MKNEKDIKDISLGAVSVEDDACVRYDYYPGIHGKEYQEEYINVFVGDRHIFVSRYFLDGDPNPKYHIGEFDLETGKQLYYKTEVESVSMGSEQWIKSMKLDKKAAMDMSKAS